MLKPASSPFALVEIPLSVRHLVAKCSGGGGTRVTSGRSSPLVSQSAHISTMEVSMTLAQGGEGDKQRWALISTATVRVFEISNPRTLAELCGGPQGTLSVGSSIDTLECRSVQLPARPGFGKPGAGRLSAKKAGVTQVAQTCVIALRLRQRFPSAVRLLFIARCPGGGVARITSGRSSPLVSQSALISLP